MKTVVTAAVDLEGKSRNRPSLYAPPLAWAVSDFARSLVEGEGGIVPNHTGMIVVSDECSLSAIREISRTAARGIVSPLRFAGASPSIVAGLPALQQGIRGPTVCLTMPPIHAGPAIAALIRYWIGDCNIAAVIAIAHHVRGGRGPTLRGLVARSLDAGLSKQVSQLVEAETGG